MSFSVEECEVNFAHMHQKLFAHSISSCLLWRFPEFWVHYCAFFPVLFYLQHRSQLSSSVFKKTTSC